jgi:tRNA(Ile)-lysidine synthase
VASVLQDVVTFARSTAMFVPGATVVCAVSGGPDSTCLLHAMVRLRRLLRIRGLVVCHVDHRLRPDSHLDAGYAHRQADRLGVDFVVRTAEGAPARGESVEAWARRVRYAALMDVREERGAQAIATGHTEDDQAEAVLMALIRGGGLEALGGMRPAGDGIVRPLLEVSADRTRAFCRSLGLRPRLDPMNEDTAYLRAAIRLRALPALREATGRDVRPTLVRTATLLRGDGDYLAGLAAEAADRVVRAENGVVRIDADQLRALPNAVAARVARLALLDAGVVPTQALVNSLLGLAAGRPGRRASLPGRLAARREREYVSLFARPG